MSYWLMLLGPNPQATVLSSLLKACCSQCLPRTEVDELADGDGWSTSRGWSCPSQPHGAATVASSSLSVLTTASAARGSMTSSSSENSSCLMATRGTASPAAGQQYVMSTGVVCHKVHEQKGVSATLWCSRYVVIGGSYVDRPLLHAHVDVPPNTMQTNKTRPHALRESLPRREHAPIIMALRLRECLASHDSSSITKRNELTPYEARQSPPHHTQCHRPSHKLCNKWSC